MSGNRDDIETIRRRNYFAERDIPCPQCGHNLRDVKGERCPECGFELRVEHGKFIGMDLARMQVESFSELIGVVLAIATFSLVMLMATFLPDDLAWIVLPQFFVAGGAAVFVFFWSSRRINRSEWVRWNILSPASNAGMMMRLFVWACTGLVAIAIVYRAIITALAIFD